MQRLTIPSLASGLFALLTVLFALPAQAADVAHRLNLSSTVDHNDNRRLRTDLPSRVTRLLLSPDLITQVADSNYTLTFDGGVTSIRSFNDSVENDRLDFRGSADLEYRLETSELGLGAQYRRVSLLDAQLEDTGIDDLDGRQTDYGGNVSWVKRFSDVTSMNLGANIGKTRITGNRLNDFLTYGVTGGLNRQVSDRFTLGLSARASRQEIEGASSLPGGLTQDTVTETAAITPRVEVRLSEFLTMQASGGVIYVTNDLDDTLSWTADVTFDLDQERFNASLDASRDYISSANGTVRETYRVNANASYEVSQYVTLDAAASYNDSALFSVTDLQVEIITGRVGATWEIAENLSARLQYQHQYQNRSNAFGSASNNQILFRLNYAFETGQLR